MSLSLSQPPLPRPRRGKGSSQGESRAAHRAASQEEQLFSMSSSAPRPSLEKPLSQQKLPARPAEGPLLGLGTTPCIPSAEACIHAHAHARIGAHIRAGASLLERAVTGRPHSLPHCSIFPLKFWGAMGPPLLSTLQAFHTLLPAPQQHLHFSQDKPLALHYLKGL